MFKKTLKVDYKEIKTLQHTINLVLDHSINRRRIHQDDMLRLMVIRCELEELNEQYRKDENESSNNA